MTKLFIGFMVVVAIMAIGLFVAKGPSVMAAEPNWIQHAD